MCFEKLARTANGDIVHKLKKMSHLADGEHLERTTRRHRPSSRLRNTESASVVCAVTIAPFHRCQEKQGERELTDVGLDAKVQSIFVDRGARTALLDTEVLELNRLILQAQNNGTVYYEAADQQRRKHNLVNWTTTVIVALTSGGSTLFNFFIAQKATESDGEYAFRIVLNLLLVFVAILNGWRQTYRPEWKAMNYEMTADDFSNYVREWRLRLVQGIDDRRERVLLALSSAQHVLREIELSAMPLRGKVTDAA